MADTARLETALRNAHAAGDVQAATRLAQALKGLRAQPAAQPAPQPISQGQFAGRFEGDDPRNSIMGRADAFMRGAADIATFGFADEIAAGADAALQPVLGTGKPGASFGDRYAQNVDAQRQIDAGDVRERGAYRLAGQVAGAVPAAMIPAGAAARGVSLAGKVGRGIVAGAAQGGAYGAGSAVEGERLRGAGEGAMVGGTVGAVIPAAGNAIGRAVGRSAGQRAAPTVEALKAASQQLYKQAEQLGVSLAPQSFVRMVDSLMGKLKAAGLNAVQQPKAFETFRLLREAQDAARRGSRVELGNMETLRQIAGAVLKDKDDNERRISHVIVDAIDDYMGGLKPADVLSGNSRQAVDLLSGARELWSRKSKGEIIDNLFERARNAVGANYTAAGFETAIRQQFRSIADKPAVFRRFSKDERAAILRVVRGAPVQNVLRAFGRLAPVGALRGMGYVGATPFIPQVAIPAAIATTAARKGAEVMSTAAAKRASAQVRAGAPAFDQGAARLADQRATLALGSLGQGVAVPTLLDLARR